MTSTAPAHVPALGASHEREEVGNQLQATLIEDHVVVRDLTRRLADVSERIRGRMDRLGELDVASQDVLVEVVRALEEQLWMIRAQMQGH